ncbi:hypothetical protein [Mycobacterium sp. 141]|uniref:hypothetical protein n=1 Tax=Mycobacterium sp. 141 TaxID=1120797 RepID=UPI00036E5418|nr:hypothetical protein [Mycobacterium sp. 141]
MPKCPNGHRNPKNQQLCSQCDALIVANAAHRPSSGSPWRYAVPVSVATSILLATALGFAVGHNVVPETPRTDVHTSTQHWWVVARPSFDELRNSLLDTRSALARQDTSALGTVCRTLHDAAVVKLRAQLPAPDPQLTAELDAAINDAHDAAHMCLAAISGSQNNYGGEFRSALDQADRNLTAALVSVNDSLSEA